MTFSKFFPVAFMVAVVAAVWIWVGQVYAVALWVPFISWAMYFVYDPAATKLNRIPKEIIGLTGGILLGYVTLWLNPILGGVVGASFGLPLTVFLVAFTIVMLELTDWFELAPAYFFAYAGYFAYVFGGFGGAILADYSNLLPVAVASLVPYWILILIGLGIGLFTAYARKVMLGRMGLYGSMQKTVFDKERE